MIDFLEYVVAELKSKRLAKTDAVSLVRQFSRRSPNAAAASLTHPLLHRNTSDLTEQRFSSTFSGDEFFLADHQVAANGGPGHKVLPGVAYLEMARAAVEQALPGRPEAGVLELHNTVWAQPIVVNGSRQVSIALIANDDEQVDYEIYSQDAGAETVHCQGRAAWTAQPAPAKLDVIQLRAEMTNGTLEPDSVYAACVRMGLLYGPSFRAITAIHRGSGQVLARLHLPDVDGAGYVMHPGLMDGALQAAVGLSEAGLAFTQPRVPFALETLRILAPCTAEMVAWVRYAPGSLETDKVVKLDVDLCDADGNVCVQMRGFSWRVLGNELAASKPAAALLAVPSWEPAALQTSATTVDFAERHVIHCEPSAPQQTIAERFTASALVAFERIQSILQAKPRGKVLVQIVVRDQQEATPLVGLSALLKTAALENPLFLGQLLVVPAGLTEDQLVQLLDDETRGTLDSLVRYRDGARETLRWQEVAAPEAAPAVFKNDGVYLITGGAGGLGLIFAKEILDQTAGARVILTGRAPLTVEKEARLRALPAAQVSYRQLDLTSLDQVRWLIASIQDDHGRLDGILHCAGLLADQFLIKKSADEFAAVLAPKVTGTYHLDQATQDLALNVFALFSSAAGAIGNPGQADYATANAFLDHFAAYRNQLVAASQRHGRTLSINWPLWQDGGMTVDAAGREQLRQTTGMQPLQTANGLQAFYRALALPSDQVLVVEGDAAQIRSALLATSGIVAEPQVTFSGIDAVTLAEKTQQYLRKQFAGLLKLPAQKIDPRAAMENYGIDSILAMKLTNQLETTFGSLPKTLFFEYQTIRELADYFVAHFATQLTAILTPAATPAAAAVTVTPVPATTAKLPSSRRAGRRRTAAAATTKQDEPIAIVGLSGRYPEAVNIEAYWTNLRDGKDCITEVPKSRWDWREYFSDDRTEGGHHYSKWGGFIAGVDEFDPLFFNISPADAEFIDPQERLFLQHAWMAMEDAGYTRASLQVPDQHDLPGQVGVYVGVMYTEYQMFGADATARGRRLGIAGSFASIANRTSYALNLHGPSMTVDSMCSSSLTAIHIACEDLKHGRTSMALAGGVNVTVHPNKYLVLSQGQFISSDGHCQSFGEGGDGYIPGEGVGVVVLKRLSDAERDGDHIYGVIRGSALNHGGKTNGYSVPNPQAQTGAIRRALADANINARHISYIEAHGTGTKLGDPIEIAALSKAFQRHTQDTGFCQIGSAKSNIGHCESAAGIAGLTKVLLQMQHQQIVPSLHSAQLNPHIDFASGPFEVNQSLRPWEQPVVDGRTLPRIAGISSFGAGGSNAHMLVEEYRAPSAEAVVLETVVILLSARTAVQLEQKTRDLLAFVLTQPSIDLVSLAYTLQVGREAMPERLGLVVSSLQDLITKMQAFISGEQAIEDAYQGQVKRNDDTLSLFGIDTDLQQAVERWIAGNKVSRLVELWVKGLDPDWSKLYGASRPRRMSLPTYPFAQERYWIDITAAGTQVPSKAGATAVLHPLLHANTSDLGAQRYRSTFTGDEFFLADHQVQAHGKVLPGVAYLEMARAAIAQALPVWPVSTALELTALELRNVVWAQPVVVTGHTDVTIALFASGNEQIDFEIYSGHGDAEIVHCQGTATFARQPAPATLDLAQLTQQMTEGQLAADTVYATCAGMGLLYGPSFQGITTIERGSGQALAQLQLPQTVAGHASDYVLHPSLLDAALQSAVALLDDASASTQPPLPFALESIRIVAPCTTEMRAWVRYAPGTSANVIKLDVDLCDTTGNVCVQLRGFSSRVLTTEAERPVVNVLAAPVAPQPIADATSLAELTQEYLRRQLSGVLKMPSHTIDPQAALEEYGIDSILAMKLTNQLEKTFGSLPKTLFFEYQTIHALAGYISAQYTAQLTTLLMPAAQHVPVAAPVQAAPAPARLISSRRFSGKRAAGTSAVDDDPIAIVGLSGRYPESVDLEAYWTNLRDGKDCITEVPKSRWDWREYFTADRAKAGHHYSKWGGFIDGVDEFDPMFFNMSPAEAEFIDPQERLFLQHAWMAMEDAGYTRAALHVPQHDLPHGHDLPGQVGVYAGVMYNEYQLFGSDATARGKRLGVPGSTASIANRVSYALNLHGPSITLDTMCSSSLTAIHFACQDLKLGRTTVAIAGGVNVSVHPNKYLVLSQGQFISSDGHCQSFGEGGDGYIPGEGVGVVVLKRLADAQRDGDHIYGLIRGSALNHGGKTNGYTVPNPQAQASAIRRALAESKVDARHVSYIEAHGTGTTLGDPIEVAALSKAFHHDTEDTAFCLIGSVKSNIGHCESAAGVAGLTKVLLQMQHQQIVPSLHSAQLNPHIDFERSPFIVNQPLRAWEQPVIDGRVLPRIAGISSFGAGGSNAHIVIEEYPQAVSQAADGPVVILLSARTPEQLQQKASDLLRFVESRQHTLDLAGLAFTLQVGREPMEERLGFVVSTVEELATTLRAHVAGEQAIEGLYQGQVTRGTGALSAFSTDADLQETVDKWLANRKLAKLVDLWVKGLELDWRKLYGQTTPQRVSLPTYPFARERYWIDTTGVAQLAGKGATATLHPLLHSNTSDLSEQRYRSTFTGDEFFLADHQVGAIGRILPGVAYLEMARAAVEQAWSTRPASTVLELRNIVWAQPVVVSGLTQVSIALATADDDSIQYEIYSQDGDDEIVHGQGVALSSNEPAPAALDLDQLAARMDRGELAPGTAYEAFSRMGLHYGPAFQGITAIRRGRGEVLAQLRLPRTVEESVSEYVLHPSLIDSALQAAAGLIDDLAQVTEPRLPFALESLRIVAPCTSTMVAWVRYADGSTADDAVVKLDIDVCDERGNVCVQLRGLSSRVATSARTADTLLAAPVWRTVDATSAAVTYTERHVILCELAQVDVDQLGTLLPQAHYLSLQPEQETSIADRFRQYAVTCFEWIQAILRGKPQGQVLIQLVVPNHPEQAVLAGLSALLKTASQENPRLTGQVILVPPATTANELASHLRNENGLEAVVRHDGVARQVQRLEEVPATGDAPVAFNDGGVYLITGGVGGLGLIFAREIVTRTAGARVVLTGRSALTAEKQALIAGLTGNVTYRQLDLNDAAEVSALVAAVREEYGQLDGILHSAGMTADRFILAKTGAEFQQVLAPKVTGTFHLDQATRDLPLDFFVLFSSVAGAMGNAGQADYATANAFLDQFAAYRNHQVALGQRHGRTRSINWPLWQSGGMTIDPARQELLQQATGVAALQTANGLQAFYRSLALSHAQLLPLQGDLPKIRLTLQIEQQVWSAVALATAFVQPQAQPESLAAPATLLENTQTFLRAEFATLLKLPVHKIDPQAPLERYGIDSILAMKLTNQLEQTFGSLSKTLFFEYQTIAALAGYFVKSHAAVLREKFAVTTEAAPVKAAAPAVAKSRPAATRRTRGRVPETKAQDLNDIAIVGLAGRYPQAENVDEFWRNLQAGRDSITEIPADRWNHELYFDADPNKAGKSYSKWGGFIDGVDKFDPLFFNISPREAAIVDPQERLFLETAWQTIEDAGYTRESISGGRVGVFVGVMWGQYELFGAEAMARGNGVFPGSSHASIANRVSYFFDFHGPSMALDTMCSSSLTAIHLACEELRRGEIDAAIAGGVNVTIHPYKYLSLSQGKFASTDGRCRSFGAGGDGYVPGEGVGAVLLKPLAHALRDGDQIYAVIKSGTVNHGGKTNGYTVPNPNAQGDLIAQALKKANIDPKTLSYIETHGTGTSLGDPIEITGLLRAFEGSTDEKQFCAIGSVKSNIGHLESAAGIAAVTKTLLQLRHNQLVPSLHAEPLNPNIDFANSPFYVQTGLSDWQRTSAHPRRAGVSSFGAGGSNAHLILEEYQTHDAALAPAGTAELFVLSAKTPEALRRYAERTAAFLADAATLSLSAIAHTAQVGRTAMDARLAIVASSVEELRNKLHEWLAAQLNADLEHVFSGNLKDANDSAGTLIEGAAGKAFLATLLAGRELEKIARLWVGGVDVDWTALYGNGHPRRVSLPTYPFAKERCWIATEAPTLRLVQATTPAPVKDEKRRTAYVPQWTPKALAPRAAQPSFLGPVLVLDSSDALTLALRAQLTEPVVLVQTGTAFEEIASNTFTIDPAQKEQFQQLVDTLASRSLLPRAVLHHAPDACDLEDPQQVARHLDGGLYSLVNLTSALMRVHHPALRLLSVFSSTAPLGAAIGGFFKTLSIEEPAYRTKSIEVAGQADVPRKAALILDELSATDWSTQELRYDGPARSVRVLVPQSAPQHPASLPLRQHGVYLITGGIGGLGLIFAEYLARNYRAKLVLLGRSAPNAKQQAALEQLASHGAELLVLQADVAKPEDLQRVVAEARTRFGSIHGVIHAAGVNRDALVLRKTRDEIEAVLAPKVFGTINLDRATRGEHLDFFVLFSSIAGVIGNAGQADYAFGNRFLDAFAAQRPGRTLSIDWPLWEEGGMTIPQDALARLEAQTGIAALPVADGLRYFEEFLTAESVQSVALYGNAARIAAAVTGQLVKSAAPVRTQDLNAATLFAKTETYLKALVGEEIALDPERIGSTDPLESFGLDSVMINKINAQLERDLGALPKTLLYEHETVRDLATYFVRESREALQARFGVEESAPAPIAATVVEETPAIRYEVVAPRDHDQLEAIAIVGIHGYYPQSETLADYWQNLKEGRDLVGLVPPSRWDYNEFYDADPAAAADGKIYCKWGAFLDHHDQFDPHFFKISTAEARLIDPQERLFLESVWAAFEDAGYTRDRLRARHGKSGSADVGVFVGVTTNSYDLWSPEERARGNYLSPTAMPWSIANRVSYFFDFNGPSLPVDTACSSSLVALHLACESLRNRECQVAVAGGVNLYLHPAKYQSLCQRRMLSLDGRNYSYGAGDDGFVPGEGVGTVILKPLSKAVADGDRIHAIIRASAFDHAGRSNGYSAPNPRAQANLITRTLEKAQIHPETISYVEGHGTGTQLGDSIEVVALTQAFEKQTAKKQFCPIGSVKANLGHSESAAGIAGLAKVILQLQHRQLAPSIHSDQPNPNIEFAQSPFYLQHGLTEWTASPDHPRRALINSFGAGGVNACVVVEEYNAPVSVAAPLAGSHLFTLSAKNEDRLRDYVQPILARLAADPGLDLAALCYTLQTGREAMEERLAIVVSSAAELIDRLTQWTIDGPAAGVLRGSLDPRRGSRRGAKHTITAAGEQSLSDLAAKWIAGEDVQWESLYTGTTPARMTLPTYPFARERYWISDDVAAQPQPQAETVETTAQLHPLVAYNSSTLKETSFTSALSDTAFYAVDHAVSGERIFPGAAYLELGCITGHIAGEQRVRKITDVIWMQPLSFRGGPQTVRTTLSATAGGADYAVSSIDDEHETIVHSEGRLTFQSGSAHLVVAEERVALDALKARCAAPEDAATCYARFREHGLQYGPSFQSIQELWVGESFALAKLSIAPHLNADFGQYILHPAIIDGALQTIAGLARATSVDTPFVPFALDELDLLRTIPQTCYAYAEAADARPQSGVMKYNIRLLSERGDVLVKFKNLYVRPLAKPVTGGDALTTAASGAKGQLVMLAGDSAR